MARRPQNSFFSADMNALGMVVSGDDNATLYNPNGTAVPGIGRMEPTASPLTGATVVFPDDDASGAQYLTPAGTIAALSITLPSNAKSIIGQVKRIMSSQTVTALTLTQAGGGLVQVGIPTTVGPAVPIAIVKVAANTWAFMT